MDNNKRQKFQLNKTSDHNFDFSKGGKRKFDLEKDIDDEIAPASENNGDEIINQDSFGGDNGKKWIILIFVTIVIAVIAWLLLGGDKDNDPKPTTDDVETIDQADIEETDIQPVVNDNEPAASDGDYGDEEASSQEGQIASDSEPAFETDASNAPNELPIEARQTVNPVAIPSSDIEAEAMKVIRGEYGDGAERVRALGPKYADIQRRVNQLKAQGAF